jgi:hypothetical protein
MDTTTARRYVIWSIEHQAWWKASRHGYAPTLAKAGRFTEEAAALIVARANRVKTEEFMIPVEAFELGPFAMPNPRQPLE